MVKPLLRVLGGALVGLLTLFCLAPGAQAYPDPLFDADVSARVVQSGATFTATSSANVDCDWTHEWNGTRRAGASKAGAFTSTFTAPRVTVETVIPVTFTCVHDAGGPGRAATWTRTIDVTVLPPEQRAPAPSHQGVTIPGSAPGSGGPGLGTAASLPSTGGPSVLFLVAGLALLVAGSAAVRLARTRALDVDAGPTHP